MKTFTFPDGETILLSLVATVGPVTFARPRTRKTTHHPAEYEEEKTVVTRRRLWYAPWIVRTTSETTPRRLSRPERWDFERVPEWDEYFFSVTDASKGLVKIWPPPVTTASPEFVKYEWPSYMRDSVFRSMFDEGYTKSAQLFTTKGTVHSNETISAAWDTDGTIVQVPDEGLPYRRKDPVSAARDALLKAWTEA